MIENDLRLGLVDLSVDVAELKHVRLHCLLENLAGKFQDAFLIGGGSNDKANRKVVRAWQRLGHDRKHLNRRDSCQFLLNDWQIIFRWDLSRAPWFQHHAAKAAAG